MPFKITATAAKIIDYIHRAGEGQAERQAVLDYMEQVEGCSPGYVDDRLQELARAGLLDRVGGNGQRASYRIDYESEAYSDDDSGEDPGCWDLVD